MFMIDLILKEFLKISIEKKIIKNNKTLEANA
jgi:hypothetical protein